MAIDEKKMQAGIRGIRSRMGDDNLPRNFYSLTQIRGALEENNYDVQDAWAQLRRKESFSPIIGAKFLQKKGIIKKRVEEESPAEYAIREMAQSEEKERKKKAGHFLGKGHGSKGKAPGVLY